MCLTQTEIDKLLQSLNDPLPEKDQDVLNQFFDCIDPDRAFEIVGIEQYVRVGESYTVRLELSNDDFINFEFHSHPSPVRDIKINISALKPNMILDQMIVHTSHGDTYFPTHILISNPHIHNFIDVKSIELKTSEGDILIEVPINNLTSFVCNWNYVSQSSKLR